MFQGQGEKRERDKTISRAGRDRRSKDDFRDTTLEPFIPYLCLAFLESRSTQMVQLRTLVPYIGYCLFVYSSIVKMAESLVGKVTNREEQVRDTGQREQCSKQM